MASSAQQEKSCIRERHRQKLHQHQHRQHQRRRRLGVAKNQKHDRQSVAKLALQRKEKPSIWVGFLRRRFDFSNRPRQLMHFGCLVLLLQVLVVLQMGNDTNAEGNVGCHFIKTLCLEDSEVCFDDNIFGKCIPTTGVDVEEIENTPLALHESRMLATMLEELQSEGLEWNHPYVQCRIQAALFSLQRQTQLPPNLCANLASTTPEVEPIDVMTREHSAPPARFYRYQQLFYPPPKKEVIAEESDNRLNTMLRQLQLQNRRHLRHDPMELEHFGKMDHPVTSQLEVPSVINAFLETERQRIEREQQARETEQEQERKHSQQSQLELYQILADSEPDPQPFQRNQPNPMEQLEEMVEQQRETPAPVYVPPEEVNESSELYFPDNYAPLKRTDVKPQTEQIQQPYKPNRSFFRELAAEQGVEQETLNELSPKLKRRPLDYRGNGVDGLDEQQQRFQESLLQNSLTPFEEEAMLASNIYPTLKHRKNDRVYAEGGLIYVPDNEDIQSDQAGVIKQSLLADMLGFARHERLDVKKPGPLLGPPAGLKPNPSEVAESAFKEDGNKEILPAHIKDNNEAHKNKKLIKNHSDEDHAPHTVDTEFAHVIVKNPIDSWNDGMRIMTELANVLHMQGYFTYLTVQPHQVSFRVDSKNPEHKTAADVARMINENRGVKNNILRRLGVTVRHAGVGDKVKAGEDADVSASRIDLAEQGPDVTHIMAYMFAGAGAAAIIVIFITLILIKRHDKSRDKLGGLQTGGIAGIAESCSKDYQDLCRARMAGKGNAAEPATSGRITTLSKENDKPPSSRSSTSSWSEEPALTNMDISTGHMVLSYMEDHLRNKGRLQREWDALCRYEAEPSAREAATQPLCANLNRTGAPLPYDHSRVVLNHLANADGLDYVNASTITDHDPRAPVCYVAAQGPLPSTLAHFWQMIWEQGAVVIVALCRLQENGEVACARYWPEEGAEVYHIYEVHLVSEHIWCDDYLVRSFYLKNLRTSETRTVTQFHFLSWPQGGVPAQAKALLDFRRKVNKSYRGRSCPIVVHGSEGAGRTGAYILLDLVLGRMNKGAREIDIAATLEHLRDQRSGLVATRQQFEFVLMAVAEEVHAILKALPANQSAEKREPSEDKAAAAQKEPPLKEEESTETPKTSKASGKAAEGNGKAAEVSGKAAEVSGKDKPKTTSAVEKETPKTPSKSVKKK